MEELFPVVSGVWSLRGMMNKADCKYVRVCGRIITLSNLTVWNLRERRGESENDFDD